MLLQRYSLFMPNIYYYVLSLTCDVLTGYAERVYLNAEYITIIRKTKLISFYTIIKFDKMFAVYNEINKWYQYSGVRNNQKCL